MARLADEAVFRNRKGDPALGAAEIAELLKLVPGWRVVDEDGVPKLRKEFRAADYAMLLVLTEKVGSIAEQANHHPEMHLAWDCLTVTWWTHVTGGLQRNDFILAARCDRVAVLVAGI